MEGNSRLRSSHERTLHETTATVLLMLLLFLTAGAAERESGQTASENAAPKPDTKIAEWISQLDDDEFKIRDRAAQGLIEAGLKALPAVLTATRSKQAEVRSGAFAILFALSNSDDKPTANAVLRAAKPNSVHLIQPQYLSKHWGPPHDEHMVHLKWLTGFRSVNFQQTEITDAGLKHLKEMTSFATWISKPPTSATRGWCI